MDEVERTQAAPDFIADRMPRRMEWYKTVTDKMLYGYLVSPAEAAAIEQAAVRAALEGHEPQMAGDGRDGDEHLGCSCGWEQSSDNDYEPWSRHVKP